MHDNSNVRCLGPISNSIDKCRLSISQIPRHTSELSIIRIFLDSGEEMQSVVWIDLAAAAISFELLELGSNRSLITAEDGVERVSVDLRLTSM